MTLPHVRIQRTMTGLGGLRLTVCSQAPTGFLAPPPSNRDASRIERCSYHLNPKRASQDEMCSAWCRGWKAEAAAAGGRPTHHHPLGPHVRQGLRHGTRRRVWGKERGGEGGERTLRMLMMVEGAGQGQDQTGEGTGGDGMMSKGALG